MKSLLKGLKAYKKETIIAPIFKMLEAIMELFVPIIVQQLIDVGIQNRDVGYVAGRCGLLVLFAVFGLLFAVIAQYYAAKSAVSFASDLRSQAFAHIQQMSFSTLDRVGRGTLITRITNDINKVQDGVNMTLRLLLRSPFIVFGSIVMAFMVNQKLSLIFLGVVVLLSIVVFLILLQGIPKYREIQNLMDEVTGDTRENLNGIRVIRAFGLEEREGKGFSEKSKTLRKRQFLTGMSMGLLNPLTLVIVNLAIVFLIYKGAIHVSVGTLTQGGVVALVNYMSRILVELVKLANLFILVAKAFASGNRVAELLSEKNEDALREQSTEVSESQEYSIVFQNVSMCYGGVSEYALEQIDFSVKKGETLGIIGGTGSGKSTLASVLFGFYPIQEGKILIDGKNVESYEKQELLKKGAIVLQKAELFSGTIEENVRFGMNEASEEAIWAALEKAQAKDFVLEKGGLKAEVLQEGRNFSGGQKQRIGIARALLRDPEILVLDDSSSALDFATDARLRKAIQEGVGNPTLLIISQRVASVMWANRILVLDDGKLVGADTHERLLKNCKVYQEICESQLTC